MSTSNTRSADSRELRPLNIVPDPVKPLEVINDRLQQAHATLDLLFTLVTDHGTSPGNSDHLEDLCVHTLGYSLHSAMLRISESVAALKALTAESKPAQEART